MKDLLESAEYSNGVKSVTFPFNFFFESELNKANQMWIKLFDKSSSSEFDGSINETEAPRILLEVTVTEQK